MARSGSGISAIFASTSLSPSALPARGRGALPLQLLGALPHRGSFLVRESLGRLAGGSLGGLLRARLCRFLSAIAKLLRAPNESRPLKLRGG